MEQEKCERNKPADTKVHEEGGRGHASDTKQIHSQLVKKGMLPAVHGGPTLKQVDMP